MTLMGSFQLKIFCDFIIQKQDGYLYGPGVGFSRLTQSWRSGGILCWELCAGQPKLMAWCKLEILMNSQAVQQE